MEFDEVIRSRAMVRRFISKPVDPAILDQLLSGALRSPTAGFAQGVDLLVLTETESRSTFWTTVSEPSWREGTTNADALMAAPVIVLALGNPRAYLARYEEPDKRHSTLAGRTEEEWPVPYWIVDCAFATMALLLGATNAGLGALFFHLQENGRAILDAFGVPRDEVPIGAVALGYEDEHRSRSTMRKRARREFGEAVHLEHW